MQSSRIPGLTAPADGTKLKEDLRAKARAEAESIVKNAERQIKQERDVALSQIRQEAVDVSLMIASKLIKRNLSQEDNEALIEEALKQVQSPPQA
jgi:F-type H+-transporting ATPase subunit b